MNNKILEVNEKIFLENISKIQKFVGNKIIMPVVKANAYGTYINKRLNILNHFPIIAVAEVKEGIAIRKIGYQKEILILNQPSIEDEKEISDYQLTIGLSEIEYLKKTTYPTKVHLEIETGMNRTGIKLNQLEEFISILKEKKNIQVEGIYTHFSSADIDENYTKKQFQTFLQALERVKKEFSLKYIHTSASNGILNVQENITNTVRPGILIYGYEPYPGAKEKIPVKPIATLKTRITYIKEIDVNEAISYNQKFISSAKMKIATIPIGYADGLKRNLTNQANVIVKGEKRKILGAICMDSCMIDVTDLEVKVGDYVNIWDNQNITVEEIAEKANTINYEIISTLSNRIERKFIEETL